MLKSIKTEGNFSKMTVKRLIKTAAVFFAVLIFSSSVFAAEVSSKASESKAANAHKGANPRVSFVQDLQKKLNAGNLEEAILAFDSLDENLKEDEGLLVIKASLLISASKIEEANLVLDYLEQKNPLNIDVLEMKIIAAKAGGEETKAQKASAISKVIALDPNNPTANIELAQENVLQRKYKTARTYYQKALVKAPKDLNALFGYGQTSYYLNDIEEAKKAFNKMLEINPNDAIAYQYLGKLEAEDDRYKYAVEFVQKAIAIEKDNYDFYMDLGTYSRFLGKFDDAEKAWTKAISINPDYFLAYAYRAGLYDEQNKLDKALKDYRKVVETNPKYYFAYEALGILAWHEGNWDEARGAFEKAYSYNAENISYPLMIAACWSKAGKYQNGKLFLEKVMKKMTDKTSLNFQMIRLFHDMGPGNAETDIALKIQKEDKTNVRGKMLYYFALYYELKNKDQLALKYYGEVKNMQSPMFFEYRLAEWSLER